MCLPNICLRFAHLVGLHIYAINLVFNVSHHGSFHSSKQYLDEVFRTLLYSNSDSILKHSRVRKSIISRAPRHRLAPLQAVILVVNLPDVTKGCDINP